MNSLTGFLAGGRLRTMGFAAFFLALVVLAGCGSRSGGGYYKDDGPGSSIPPNIAAIPDAVPRIERHAPANFRPYSVFGVRYFPISEDQPYRQQGLASWYGKKFHGQKTANGEIYDMYAMTAAHPTLPLPSYARVTRVANGRSIIVRINDRGPFHSGRIIDLSYVAAAKLGLIGPGSGQVVVQAITNADIRAGRYPAPGVMASAPPPPATPPPTSRQDSAGADIQAVSQQAPTIEDIIAPHTASGLGAGGIYLQFGAFSSAENAQALAQRINTIMEWQRVSVHHEPPLYKVRMGPYPSRAAAEIDSAQADSAGLHPVLAFDQGL